MSTFYKPRHMTEEEQSVVATFSLTYGGDMLEYDEKHLKVQNSFGALVYASCDIYIAITELGRVSTHEDITDALIAAM